ncbi:MAG TPA: SRPBCC family protein, partial [Candidatus Binatia bacterium]|nr:SRPBCC family protein [Candidatus Binatia bacterium]
PDSIKVQRSIVIKAAPDRIFTLINDFKAWPQWSPYETKDPNMQRTLSGADQGKGAIYAWNGNRNVGAGRMEILESTAPTKIAIKLDFMKPIEGHNIATFTMVPNGEATEVTWTMEGPAPFIGKVMGVFFDLDKMIGSDFDAGLANLKRVSEQ